MANEAGNKVLGLVDLSDGLEMKMAGMVKGVDDVKDALDGNPLDKLMAMPLEELAALREILTVVRDDADIVIKLLAFIEGVRAKVDATKTVVSEKPMLPSSDMVSQSGRERNEFAGEAHLEEIDLNVVLTLDFNTGLIQRIEVLDWGVKAKSLAQNQIQTTIDGGEYAKEIFSSTIVNWNTENGIRVLDKEIEDVLKERGKINKDGQRMDISILSSGQIPSSRAWANPNKKLFPKWNDGKRASLASERKAQLAQQ